MMPKQMTKLALTEREKRMLCAAVELRAEACEENADLGYKDDAREAKRWRALLAKLLEVV
jgi:hypothetical protein